MPAASVAHTSKVCEPGVRSEYVLGEVHGSTMLSSAHSKVELGSLLEKLNVALALEVDEAGAESIVVCGALVSGGATAVQV